METFSTLLALCVGNSPVNGEFPSQRPVMRSFNVFSYLCLNKWLSKQSRCWWFEPPSCSLWWHCNVKWWLGARYPKNYYLKEWWPSSLIVSHYQGLTYWWRRHQMETFSVLQAFVHRIGEYPSQWPLTWSFGILYNLHLNEPLSKQSRHQYFEMPSCSLWCNCSALRPEKNVYHHANDIFKFSFLYESYCMMIQISVAPLKFGNYTPRTTKLLGGILVSLRPSVRPSVRLSVRPSVRLSRLPCPLCNIYSSGLILSILATNDHYHERVCRTQWPLTLTYIFKVIRPWLRKSCPLCSVYSSGWILFIFGTNDHYH